MLGFAATRALRKATKIAYPGSSLLNSRSQRAKLRNMMDTHHKQMDQFEDQVLFADIGGSAASGAGGKSSTLGQKKRALSKRQRTGKHVQLIGEQVAERAKHMTDSEWESVPMEDKHAFTKFMSRMLREHPTEATEQQRRRYFETTMADPRDLDPARTVRDEFERIKMGLPVQLKNPQRSLGVSQALYDAADPSLFDPENVHVLENAMTNVKQVFADYVRKKREGVSTEAERRQLANMTAQLNVETQRHLASMFKYAEEKLRRHAMEERGRQLRELERLKRFYVKDLSSAASSSAMMGGDVPSASPPPSASADTPLQEEKQLRQQQQQQRRLTRAQRKARVKESISKAVGLDLDVVDSLLSELHAQEQFMQFCEVFARLTLGHGFEHTPSDEGLDAYTESVKRLYSADAKSLSMLDVVQYMAAKDEAHPVEWAQRWYERALLVPLSRTPEYRRLQEIQQVDRDALALQTKLAGEQGRGSSDDAAKAGEQPASSLSAPEESVPESSNVVAQKAEVKAARLREEKVVNIVEKMFLKPDDSRLRTVHEKRLRYLAYLQMERQIRQARANAKLFAGVEFSPEAEECRALYKQLLSRKEALEAERAAGSSSSAKGEASSCAEAVNVFNDPEADALFGKIRDITISVIHAGRAESKAAAKARTVAKVLEAVKGAGDANLQEMKELLAERKQRVSQRLLAIMERDVRSEMQWLEQMQEAERPPLLAIPEGMSYVSAGEVQAWRELREEETKAAGNPFTKNNVKNKAMQASFLGQPWRIPDKPMLFWGTGTKAVQQALQHAAADADRKRRGEPLAPPYPCPENPWGWRLVKDILDD